MRIGLSAFALDLQTPFRRPLNVFAAYSVCYSDHLLSRLSHWQPLTGTIQEPTPVRWDRLQCVRGTGIRQGDLYVADLPADRVLRYDPVHDRHHPYYLACPRAVPLVFGAAALPLEVGVCVPPRIASDLALEQGLASDSAVVKVLREELADYGGIELFGLYEAGSEHLLAVKQTRSEGGMQNRRSLQCFFLSHHAFQRYAQEGSRVSVADLFDRISLESRYRLRPVKLRLLASVDEPWTAERFAPVWDEWSAAGQGQ